MLSEYQNNFILEFFKNSADMRRFPGWESIAKKLISTGRCIVAGDKSIWNGGIGNFIKTSESEDAIGCLLYEFDLEYFLTSKFYKERVNTHISNLLSYRKKIDQEYADLCNLSNIDELMFTVKDAKFIYNIGFNHAKACAKYQGDDIVEIFKRASELDRNLNFD